MKRNRYPVEEIDPGAPTATCFFCGKLFQHGMHVYGHYINYYQIEVCRSCYDGNWDGYNPSYEKKLLEYLHEKNIRVPARSEKGLLRRDP